MNFIVNAVGFLQQTDALSDSAAVTYVRSLPTTPAPTVLTPTPGTLFVDQPWLLELVDFQEPCPRDQPLTAEDLISMLSEHDNAN